MIRVQADSFDPGLELNRFMQGQTQAGAVVSFTGHVRDKPAQTSPEQKIIALELDHYPGYTQSEIAKIEAEALNRWPKCEILIIHRYGRMYPGEAIVFVAVRTRHRHHAFSAASFLMDYLKTDAPFWKKEIRSQETVWIEPTQSDYKHRKGWE